MVIVQVIEQALAVVVVRAPLDLQAVRIKAPMAVGVVGVEWAEATPVVVDTLPRRFADI